MMMGPSSLNSECLNVHIPQGSKQYSTLGGKGTGPTFEHNSSFQVGDFIRTQNSDLHIVRDERYHHNRMSHDDGSAITETTDDNDERLIKDVSKVGKYGTTLEKRPPKKSG